MPEDRLKELEALVDTLLQKLIETKVHLIYLKAFPQQQSYIDLKDKTPNLTIVNNAN